MTTIRHDRSRDHKRCRLETGGGNGLANYFNERPFGSYIVSSMILFSSSWMGFVCLTQGRVPQ